MFDLTESRYDMILCGDLLMNLGIDIHPFQHTIVGDMEPCGWYKEPMLHLRHEKFNQLMEKR